MNRKEILRRLTVNMAVHIVKRTSALELLKSCICEADIAMERSVVNAKQLQRMCVARRNVNVKESTKYYGRFEQLRARGGKLPRARKAIPNELRDMAQEEKLSVTTIDGMHK